MSKPKPAAATRVDGSQKSAAEKDEGSTGTAGMAIRASASESSSSSAGRVDTADRGSLNRFLQAMGDVAKQFKSVGNWVNDKMNEFAEELNLPDLLKQFNELNPLLQALILIGILAVVYLIGTFVWQGVAYIWPYIMDFIKSPAGQSFVNNASNFLEFVSTCPLMAMFTKKFETAATADKNDETLPACYDSGNFDSLKNAATGNFILIDIITAFFQFAKKRFGV